MTMDSDMPNELVSPSVALGAEFVLPADEAGAITTTSAERLAFRVGSLGLLCAADTGREVVPPPGVSRLPHLAPWLTGVANVRGVLLPVVDLAQALGVGRDESQTPYLLLFGAGDSALGLLVDGLPMLRSFEPGERMSGVPPHPSLLKGHVYGAFERNGEVWLDIDVQAFFETLGERIAA